MNPSFKIGFVLSLSLSMLAACAADAGDGSSGGRNDALVAPREALPASRDVRAAQTLDLRCVEVEMCMHLSHFDTKTCRCERNPACTCDADCEAGECVDDPFVPGTKVCDRVTPEER